MNKIKGFVMGLALLGCEPAPCYECYDVFYSDGTSDWICVQYNCDRL